MKSARNKKLYLSMNSLQITSTLALAAYAGLAPLDDWMNRLVLILLAVVILFCFGLAAIHKYHEHWIKYRTSAESLKHIKYLFETRSEPFNGDDAFNALVVRVEALISPDHTDRTERTAQ